MTKVRSTSRSIALAAGVVWLSTFGMGLGILWIVLATDFVQATAAESGAPQTAEQLLVNQAVIIAFVVITVGYASVGALLAGRSGAGRIGALLLVGGALFALVPFGYMVGGSLVLDARDSALFNAIFQLGPVALGPGYTTILPGLAIAFPDGRLPSRRWRWPVGIALGVVAVGTVLELVRAGPVADVGGTRNPFGIEALPEALVGLAQGAITVGILGMTAFGIAAVITRYRRGDAVERQQQRWFLAAVSLAAVPLALSVIPGIGGPGMALAATLGLALVPIAVGIAVTRYRLYEIDHLISRTLVYVPLTALLAGLYAATVTMLQRIFQSITGNTSDAAIIISTLILASVFTPVRKWLEGIVERRFKPAPHTPPAELVETTMTGTPEWEDRVAAVALRVVRRELEALDPGGRSARTDE